MCIRDRELKACHQSMFRNSASHQTGPTERRWVRALSISDNSIKSLECLRMLSLLRLMKVIPIPHIAQAFGEPSIFLCEDNGHVRQYLVESNLKRSTSSKDGLKEGLPAMLRPRTLKFMPSGISEASTKPWQSVHFYSGSGLLFL